MNKAATASTEDESQTSFRSVNSARGKVGVFFGSIGLSFLCMGIAFGSMIRPPARYSWPGAFSLLFIAIGLFLLAFFIVAAIRNLTYYTTIAHGTLEWGRIDNGTISGTLQLSEVQRINCIDGTDEGFHIDTFLKSGKWVVIDGRYFCGNSAVRRLLSFVGDHYKEIEIQLNGVVTKPSYGRGTPSKTLTNVLSSPS